MKNVYYVIWNKLKLLNDEKVFFFKTNQEYYFMRDYIHEMNNKFTKLFSLGYIPSIKAVY